LLGLRGVRLKDAKAVRLLLSKLIKSNLDGDLPNDQLRALTSCCNTILSTLETAELSERIERIEKQLNIQT